MSADMPLVIGLVGAIGAGKSTVARRFAERGALLIGGDEAGHEVLTRPEIAAEVQRRFGANVANADGSIHRGRLGALVFADAGKLRQLEELVHPAIGVLLAQQVATAKKTPNVPLIIVDAAVMLEAGWNGFCDRLVFVDAPRPLRLERLHQGRGWTADELTRRENAQWPLDKKKALAHVVLFNDGDLAHCHARVDELFASWTNSLPVTNVSGASKQGAVDEC